jgi:hypothetical protein
MVGMALLLEKTKGAARHPHGVLHRPGWGGAAGTGAF